MTKIMRHFADGATRARAVVHGGRVYTVATSPVKSESMVEQTREALKQLDMRLAEAGTNKSHVLSVQVFIADMSRKADMNRAWDAWVDPKNPPQRACMGTKLEDRDLVEMVAVAALP
jgi:enamine deaminase RidA (YjgF/YER057c/UK114 family)